ncbi:MAG: divergent polysaccharide deacetylase family protein [Magnetospirillum sp. WYHS-4]
MKFSLPGLGKLFGRKKDGDDEAEEEDYEADEEAPADEKESAPEEEADEDTAVAAKPAPAKDGDDDDDAEEDEVWADEDKGGRAKAMLGAIAAPFSALGERLGPLIGDGKRRIVILSAAGTLGALLFGLIGFLLFAGDSPPPPEPPTKDIAAKGGPAPPGEAPPPPRFGPDSPAESAPPPPDSAKPPPPTPGLAEAVSSPAPPSSPTAGIGSAATPATPEAASTSGTSASVAGLVVPSVLPQAYTRIREVPAEKPLVAQADPALLEKTAQGNLPRAGPGGRLPWQAYARPANPNEDRPRIAVVVRRVGLSPAATDAAIRRLPGAVTLALDPHGADLDAVGAAARGSGHEVLMTLPLASDTFPIRDPGPYALQVATDPAENLGRLRTVLGKATGYVGVLSAMGGTLLGRDDQLRPILLELKSRGVMFVDGGGAAKSLVAGISAEIGLPRAIVKVVLDEEPSRAAIDAKLAELEKIARTSASTVALASAYPVTLERLATWIATLDAKHLALMPITALADRQFE